MVLPTSIVAKNKRGPRVSPVSGTKNKSKRTMYQRETFRRGPAINQVNKNCWDMKGAKLEQGDLKGP